MASIESTLSEMFEKGLGPITIGKPPPNSGPPGATPNYFVNGMHGIATGPYGNSIEAKIQGAGDTIGEAMTRFADVFEKLEKSKTKPSGVLIPGKNAGNGGRIKLS